MNYGHVPALERGVIICKDIMAGYDQHANPNASPIARLKGRDIPCDGGSGPVRP